MAPHSAKLLAGFLLLCRISLGNARNLRPPLPTPPPQLYHGNGTDLDKRADMQTEMSTCGYQDGDPKKMRTANPGFNCRVDTMNGLWGFCPTTVIAATDCGLAGSCVDAGACSSGCGNTANTKLTTFTCETKQFCSTALLTFGVDQTYSYIGCGGSPKTDHYLITPNAQPTSTTAKQDSKPSDVPTTSTAKKTETSAAQSPTKPTDAASSTASGSTTASTAKQAAGTDASTAGETNGTSGNNKKGDSSPNNTGAIIGGVVGGVALLCISAIVAIWLLRRNRSNTRPSPPLPVQTSSYRPWQDQHPKDKHRFTGGWGPRELQGSQYERPPNYPIELPS